MSDLDSYRDVHFGAHARNVEALREALRELPDVVVTFADGDGWNVWGEAPGDDHTDYAADTQPGEVNDATTHHVIARIRATGDAEAVVAGGLATGHLVPLGQCSYQGGEIAVLTDAVDWSELDGGRVRTWERSTS